MRGVVLAVGLAAVAGAGAGAAQAARAPEVVRRAVATEVAGVRDQWLEPGDARFATPPAVDDMLSPLDVNGDGVTDWRADYGRAEWPGGWCGTGGCAQRVWVSARDGGWVLAVDTQMHSLQAYDAGGERRLETWVHGTRCGGAGSDRCHYAYAWDAEANRLVERPTRAGVTRLSGSGALLVDAPSRPAEVEAAVAALNCEGEGEGGLAHASNMPDLNGDGVRDWVLESGYACLPGPRVVVAMLSGPDGVFREGRRSLAESWAVDIAQTPATLVLQPDCDGETPCPETTVRWDPNIRRREAP